MEAATHLCVTPDVGKEANLCGPEEVAWKNKKDFALFSHILQLGTRRHARQNVCTCLLANRHVENSVFLMPCLYYDTLYDQKYVDNLVHIWSSSISQEKKQQIRGRSE